MEPITRFRGAHAFLSNFATLSHYEGEPAYITEETEDGIIHYPTVEHAYQACKTTDSSKREALSLLDSPVKAKHAGRRLRLRSGWETMMDDVMLDLVRIKFTNPTLKRLLMETYPRPIKHVNAHGDIYWGCDVFLEGEDRLGKILMTVRDELRSTT